MRIYNSKEDKTLMKMLPTIFLLVSFAQSADTLRVATYNILNYNGTARNEYLQPITNEIDADILIVQEILSQTAVNSFSTTVLNNNYSTIHFNDGPDTDNHIFYKTDKVKFISDSYISTELRDIAEYKLKVNSTEEFLFIYSAHLKASQGSDNEQKRLAECTIWRDHLNQLPTATNFIILGDFNFYDSGEPGYQKLLADEADNDGRSFDPIDSPGNWHNSESFAGIHTQSPRVEQFGGGASGGLDDRFDFILISEALNDEVLPNSYTEYGNDGQHFNVSINEGENGAVSSEIADALYYGSDHLPVYCDFVFDEVSGIESENPKDFLLLQNYPNPFNSTTNIVFEVKERGNVKLDLYDTSGKKVLTLIDDDYSPGKYEHRFDANSIASGEYYIVLSTDARKSSKKISLIK
ncbi:MAG: T9SS C-terminal target domain-containing protein [Calditrichaeota bacterium]|nr:MAG: T9SS C-terminal target domain-containing protein [Calditrichota bacterium]MBL1207975.1 T9SS C-terminal target domain-containing protein [Calditrichota bacterium]NOG47811.1 T9SS type A sorting domain-containing protein [Calditrichota bacterium]